MQFELATQCLSPCNNVKQQLASISMAADSTEGSTDSKEPHRAFFLKAGILKLALLGPGAFQKQASAPCLQIHYLLKLVATNERPGYMVHHPLFLGKKNLSQASQGLPSLCPVNDEADVYILLLEPGIIPLCCFCFLGKRAMLTKSH